MAASDWLSARMFNWVHGHNLVYNTCWEDPRLDRVALELGPDDTVMVITSAGCNALDYALQGPRRVHAVDMNPRQNALLELKLAGIRRLAYPEFFSMFGQGYIDDPVGVYRDCLRGELSPAAQQYWDRYIRFFSGRGWRPSFYFRGTSGIFARMVNLYVDRVAKVRDAIDGLLCAGSVDEQREIYDSALREEFWKRWVRWCVGRDATLSLLGVPRPQRQQVEKDYVGGIAQFIEDSVEAVFAQLPIHDNYFWRVYLSGRYTPECCPEYLKPDNFMRLKAGLADRISIHTSSILGFLRDNEVSISRYVLLDHMDWLSSALKPVLEQEWQAIIDRAAPGARVIWRSGGLKVDFVDPIAVRVAQRQCTVGELLTYNRPLAEELHARDRVHTYGSFYIANLATA